MSVNREKTKHESYLAATTQVNAFSLQQRVLGAQGGAPFCYRDELRGKVLTGRS